MISGDEPVPGAMLGHDAAWHEWRSALSSGRMHHAWLLLGAKGTGKGIFARAAARELVTEPGVHQPQADAHPDIFVLEKLPDSEEDVKRRDQGKPYKTKRNITIAQIREMQRRLTTRPTLGSAGQSLSIRPMTWKRRRRTHC